VYPPALCRCVLACIRLPCVVACLAAGVGKTELAKALAAYLFNSEEAMVRLDMSE
jgi:AAA domain (Cdc48 subfamily)